MDGQKKILVTGATGTVGAQVVAALVDAGAQVRALTRDPRKARWQGPEAEVVSGDLTRPHTLRAALDGVEAVFLVWPFATAQGLPAVLEVIAEHAHRVVYLSSAAVRDHERQAEQLIQRTRLEWTFLRPHAFAANALGWAEQIRSEGTVRGAYGAATTPPIDERDIAAVAVRALTEPGHDGAAYELTGPEALSHEEQVGIIGEVIGRPVRWMETPVEDARRWMLERGWPDSVVNGVLQAQAELVTDPWPVTSTVEKVTGTAPRTFRAWVADHAAAFVTSMRAARIHEYGDAGVIRYEEVPLPEPGPDEVLIRVAATSFNPSELGLRTGYLKDVLQLEPPLTLGMDVSGTIVQVGSDSWRWRVGDRVIGRVGDSAAEYVTAPASVLVKAPVSIPLAEAAAIPVAGLTAYQAVHEHARITSGQRVLLNGAGGGVGLFAVQLAKRAGARVIATASARSEAAVRALGADEVIDYTATPLADALDRPVESVVNLAAIAPSAAADLVPLVRPGGHLVSIATPVEPPAGARVTAAHFVARNDPAQLAEIVRLIDLGELTVEISESRRLSDTPDVHREAEAGRIRGKVILVP